MMPASAHAPSVSPSPSAAPSPSAGTASSPAEPTSPVSAAGQAELGSDGLPRGVEVVRWEEERVLVFQLAVGGEVVARRVDNGYVNGTKLLNLAVLTRGRRDSQLKNVKDRHVVLKGPRNLKGVWIPLAIAQQLASRFNLASRLGALLQTSLRCPQQSADCPRPARASAHHVSALAANAAMPPRRAPVRPVVVPVRKSVADPRIAHRAMPSPISADAGPSGHHASSFPWPSTSSTEAMRLAAVAGAFNVPESPSPVFASSPQLASTAHFYGGYLPVTYNTPLLGYSAPSYPYHAPLTAPLPAGQPASAYAALGQEFEAAMQRGWAATSPFAGAPPAAPIMTTAMTSSSCASSASAASSSAASTVMTAGTDSSCSPQELSKEQFASPQDPWGAGTPAGVVGHAIGMPCSRDPLSPLWGTRPPTSSTLNPDGPLSATFGAFPGSSSFFSTLPSPTAPSCVKGMTTGLTEGLSLANPYIPALGAFHHTFPGEDANCADDDARRSRSLSEGEARKGYLTPAPSPFLPHAFENTNMTSHHHQHPQPWEYLTNGDNE